MKDALRGALYAVLMVGLLAACGKKADDTLVQPPTDLRIVESDEFTLIAVYPLDADCSVMRVRTPFGFTATFLRCKGSGLARF